MTTNRFNQVTDKIKKMYKGTEEQKDTIVTQLKTWAAINANSQDKCKVEAIKSFLAGINVF
jgi:hypothetical protein